MRTVRYIAQVDEEKCMGCRTCTITCPTAAIEIVDKKAHIDSSKCLACPNCTDRCPEGAMELVLRAEPMTLAVDPLEVDQEKLRDLCVKANLHPHQWGCMCNRTRVSEVAAAVLKGAKTLEEICLMTGIRSGCTAYCVHHMLRLLKAHGIEIKEPKNEAWYNSTQTIWELPDEVAERYPGHFFKEDKEVFRKF